MQYRVSSLINLQKISKHFDKYPLKTKKQADYLLFKQAMDTIRKKEHLSSTGLFKLVGIKATLNRSLYDKLKQYFPTVKPITKPLVKLSAATAKINLNWIRGFIEAEASFQVITEQINNRTITSLCFSTTRHNRDKILLNNLVSFLQCGGYFKGSRRGDEARYLVTRSLDINVKIIPLLNEYPLIGAKKQDYKDFVKVAELIKYPEHLTLQGVKRFNWLKIIWIKTECE